MKSERSEMLTPWGDIHLTMPQNEMPSHFNEACSLFSSFTINPV